MADDMRIAFEAIARKLAGMHDGDILREGVRMLAHALMEAEVEVTVHGVSWERATGDWSCHARCSLKAAWDQAEAGRSWGTAWPAMLAVQTSAR